ncbi:B-type flagellin [Planctomycetes bacterium MalM25]|nr:B-type flagellin [Planctomycetes bacterium MalM25]
MTRINTNVSSLVGRNNLQSANADLSQSLTRLSTGLRINTGKDDPAGLIASENLRSDITSIKRAISNTDRANQVIATADSALGQVSSLLNDIRGLVTESANSGALSDEQISANQLQVDSSLEALNRIAQTTEFQGRRLLNGSLDFTVSGGANFSNISDLSIDQANLGATGEVAVEVDVQTAATQASVEVTGIDLDSAAAQGVSTVGLTAVVDGANGTIEIGGDTLTLETVDRTGATLDGTYTINITDSGSGGLAVTGSGTDIDVDLGGATSTFAQLATAIQGDSRFSAVSAATGTGNVAIGDDGATGDLVGSQVASTDTITLTTVGDTNDYNATTLDIVYDETISANSSEAAYDADSDTITVSVNGDQTYAQIATTISTDLSDTFTAAATTGTGTVNGSSQAAAASNLVAAAPSFVTPGNPGGLSEDIVFELAGATGAEVFSFQAGTSLEDVISSINLFTDSTGVEAAEFTTGDTTLTLQSADYGSNAFVDVNVVTEGQGTSANGDFTTAIGSGARDIGSDVVATVNGLLANADGNSLSINTASLDLSLDLVAGTTGTVNFDITGGGALFQLGADVVSNQQARLGIGSVNTASLGGVSGLLYQLGSGQASDLASDPTTAFQIVDQAIDQVTSLRGRLGAFQRTSLETNKNALNDTLTNLTEAESSIRDADFAEETANLTRSQILVQSGTRVLAIANQNPQNVLALLG